MKILLLILVLATPHICQANAINIDSLDWKLKKERDGIRVMSAKVAGSRHHAYLAETIINARIENLVDIIRNPSTCSNWVHRCKDSYQYGQEGPNIDLVYTSTEMPFPVKARDTLARITWEKDPDTQVVRAIGRSTKNILAQNNEHLRIEDATAVWELTPLPGGNTKVRSFVHADPKVKVPAWLSNKLAIDMPIKTLRGLERLASEKR
jgi:hypothetical protein